MTFHSVFENEGPLSILETIDSEVVLKSEAIFQTDKFEIAISKPSFHSLDAYAVLTTEYIYILKTVPKLSNDKMYLNVRFRLHLRWMRLAQIHHTTNRYNGCKFGITLCKRSRSLNLATENYEIYRKWLHDLQPLVLHNNFMDKYKIKEFIGSGATSKVYRVADISTRQNFACKRLKKERMGNFMFFKMVVNEISLLTKLRDCNEISRLIEVHESANSVYIITELLEGGRTTKQNTKYPPEEIYALTQNLLGALKKLDDRGIVHRDLKPGNIILKYSNVSIDKNVIKLIDFGFSIETTASKPVLLDMACGTMGYVPPDILRSNYKNVDYSSWDMYSAGIIIYNAMTGLRLFNDSDDKVQLELNKASVIDFNNSDFVDYPRGCKLNSSESYQRHVGT